MERRQTSAVFRLAASGLSAPLRALLSGRKNRNGRRKARESGSRRDESALCLRSEMGLSGLFPSGCRCRSGSLRGAFIRFHLQGNDHGSVRHLSELFVQRCGPVFPGMEHGATVIGAPDSSRRVCTDLGRTATSRETRSRVQSSRTLRVLRCGMLRGRRTGLTNCLQYNVRFSKQCQWARRAAAKYRPMPREDTMGHEAGAIWPSPSGEQDACCDGCAWPRPAPARFARLRVSVPFTRGARQRRFGLAQAGMPRAPLPCFPASGAAPSGSPSR